MALLFYCENKCDPVGIQTQDLQNRNLTLYSAKLRDLYVCLFFSKRMQRYKISFNSATNLQLFFFFDESFFLLPLSNNLTAVSNYWTFCFLSPFANDLTISSIGVLAQPLSLLYKIEEDYEKNSITDRMDASCVWSRGTKLEP